MILAKTRSFLSSKLIVGTLISVTLGLVEHAQADQSAVYLSYTPQATLQKILASLSNVDLYVVPKSFTTLSAGPALQGAKGTFGVAPGFLDPNVLLVGRGSGIVGLIQFREDTLTGSAQLLVFTAGGAKIAEISESVTACPSNSARGHCHTTTYQTTLKATVGQPPNAIVEREPYGVSYYIQGNEAQNSTSWFSEVDEDLDYIIRNLSVARDAVPLSFASSLQRVQFALATDPLLAPHFGRLNFSTQGGRLFISGSLPSTATYNLFIQRLMSAGVLNFRENIIIDSGYRGSSGEGMRN